MIQIISTDNEVRDDEIFETPDEVRPGRSWDAQKLRLSKRAAKEFEEFRSRENAKSI